MAAGLGDRSADFFGAIAEGFEGGPQFMAFHDRFHQAQWCGTALLLPALLQAGAPFQAQPLSGRLPTPGAWQST